jgi:glycerophosphoryl diester phosphodiesterase
MHPRVLTPEIWSHRGRVSSQTHAAENTVPAFRAASSSGVDGIELDAWLTSDGAFVVHHNRRVAGHWVDRARRQDLPEEVPDLADALDACRVGTVNVELKVPTRVDEQTTRSLGRALAQHLGSVRTRAGLVMSSFAAPAVLAFRDAMPAVPVALLTEHAPTDEDLRGLAREGIGRLHLEARLVSGDVATSCRSAGLGLVAWTADKPGMITRLIDLDVDAIITNVPGLALRLRDG